MSFLHDYTLKKFNLYRKKEVKCVAKQKLHWQQTERWNLSEKVCSLLASSTGICWASVVHIYRVFCAIQHVDTKSFPVGSSMVVYGHNTDGNSTVDALWHTNLIDLLTRRRTIYSPFDPMSRAVMDSITSATSYILTRSCKQLISISQSKTVADVNK